MKFNFYPMAIAVAAMCLASCSKEVEIPVYNEPDPPVWTLNNDNVELGTTDFDTFDIKLDYTKLDEKLYTDPANEWYVENTNFENDLNIEFNGDKVTVTGGNPDGVSFQACGAHVIMTTTKDMACTLTGKSANGSLKVVGDNNVRITLKGVDLKNTSGPAISSQSKKHCYLVTDSASVLRDDTVYAQVAKGEQVKGCVCSKGKLAISGTAPLKIIANGADAVHSGKTIFVRRGSNLDIESHAASAIKAKNNVMVEGGVININSTGHGGHGIAAQKKVEIAGGRTTIISNTGHGINGKNSRGIKCDSIVDITGGIVRVRESSVGGKGIRAGHKFHAQNCIIDVLTFGDDDKVTGSKNRGIKGADEIRIDSARVRVRTENGWNEGLSSKYKIIINNSLVELKTRDDAISAGKEGEADIEINNSRIYGVAGMDVIDSNGTIHVNSGLLFLVAQSHMCRGLDCDKHELKIGPDAIVVSLGQQISRPTVNLLEHPMCLILRTLKDKDFCLSTTGKNDNIISFKSPKLRFDDGDYLALLNVPQFKENVSFDFCSHATVKPEHTFHGLMIGGTATDKSVTAKRTLTERFSQFVPVFPKASSEKGAAKSASTSAAKPVATHPAPEKEKPAQRTDSL